MDEWEIPLVVKDHENGKVISVDGVFRANKVHKRLCLAFIVMAFVGGGLTEIGDTSAPDECEEGGAPSSRLKCFSFGQVFLQSQSMA